MSNTFKNEARAWDILLVDLVAYSELSSDGQMRAIMRLTDVVRASETIVRTAKGERIFLPTGDGMAVGFRGAPERPALLAIEIHKAYEAVKHNDRFLLKMGIHSGIAFNIKDINDQPNIAGAGINKAARTLSCCSPGHVLIAEQPGKDLMDIASWKSRLRGPYRFIVKHRKHLVAYNLCDEAAQVGSIEEPRVNRLFASDDETLVTQLEVLGIGPNTELRRSPILKLAGTPLAIDTVIVELPILGFVGVPCENTEIRMLNAPPNYPLCVENAKALVPEPKPNRPKVYLADWTPPLSDDGNILRLTLGRTDFWTSKSVDASADQIKSNLENGNLELSKLPRRLALHIVVVTADDKLILCRRTETVDYEKGAWSATFEENLDPKMDSCADGLVDLDKGVRRGLGENEELGLSSDVVQSAIITLLALGIEWNILGGILIVLVKLPRTGSQEVLDCLSRAGDKEHQSFDCIDFSIPRCLAILADNGHTPLGRPGETGRLHQTSRVRILAALFSVYGTSEVFIEIKRVAARVQRSYKTESRPSGANRLGNP